MGRMIVLLQLLFLVSSVASVDISLTSGELCEGAVATWTCVVNGGSIGWRNLGETAFPFLSPNLVPLGAGSPFNSTVTSINGSIITSIARAKLTTAVNGSLLECTNGSFSSPTENVTVILKDSKAANLSSPVFFGDGIRITWGGATCSLSYRLSVYLSVYEVDVINIAGTTYMYDFIPVISGEYSFKLTSVDYLGNHIGNSTNSTFIPWKEPKFFVDININNSIANFTFKNGDDERPPVTNCTISFDGVLKSCLMNNIVIFNITSGVRHSYNITITNAAGTVSMNGDLSNVVHNTTIEVSASIDPVVIASPPAALGVLIILSVCWILLRICWKRQWCCPRIWRSSFWLIFFCYDCCTYDVEEKEQNAIGLKNPNAGGEKGNDTPL